MPSLNIRAIVFDFDGTLVTGTNSGYIRCYHEAALKQGQALPFEETEKRTLESWGKAPRIVLQNILRENPERVDAALAEYEKLLDTSLFSRDIRTVDRAREELLSLREAGFITVVISGMPIRLLQKFSKDLPFGPSELISTIDTDDPLRQKATGYHLRRFMDQFNLRPEDVLVVGDAPSDIQMARSQKARVAVVLSGGFLSQSEALRQGADFVISDVRSLRSLIFQGEDLPKAANQTSL